jgi:hypothetical protein
MRSGGFGLGTENASYEPKLLDAAQCANGQRLAKPTFEVGC